MKSNVAELPIAHEALGEMIRGQDWGGMTSAYMQYPTGLDFCPLLEGLERDHCQCPHWGFVLQGQITTTDVSGKQHRECQRAGKMQALCRVRKCVGTWHQRRHTQRVQ